MAKALLQQIRSKRRKRLIAATAIEEIRKDMERRVKPVLLKEMRAIVSDWETDIDFGSRLYVRPDEIVLYVFPRGENKDIFKFVDRGTKRHKIRARNAPRLAFQVPTEAGAKYVPKTAAKPARTIPGGGHVPKPRTLVRPIEVDHPGSEARDFTGAVAKKYKPEFKKAIDAAFKRAARKLNS